MPMQMKYSFHHRVIPTLLSKCAPPSLNCPRLDEDYTDAYWLLLRNDFTSIKPSYSIMVDQKITG